MITRGIHIMKKTLAVLITACSLSLGLTPALTGISGNLVIEAEAHPGRTDANGGHRDNKNVSGLGSYHYHCGGHPAHLHPNGVCPYAGGSTDDNSRSSGGSSSKNQSSSGNQTPKETAAPQVSTGWQKDDHGWWYRLSADSYYADGVADIDGSTYLFNSDGYMLTGWQQLNGHWYYFNPSGAMVTGGQIIEGKYYYFDSDGVLDETYYDAVDEPGDDTNETAEDDTDYVYDYDLDEY